ncbi:MAG: site-specific integrase [Treponema sp.]|jgi:site-specific recombinase XerD|nr:site-specific integrase [Treponema sp.]
MDVVYFFREAGIVRVPFFSYDQTLLGLFTAHGWTWNRARREFIFSRDINAKHLSGILSGIPCVWVEEDSPSYCRLQVYGFWERTWETAAHAANLYLHDNTSGYCVPAPHSQPFAFPRPIIPPEKLSEEWRAKLEVELRSRKYSPQTRRAYIYYNRLICRTLQKTPEEIRPDDVTEFLAFMEKDKKYSASAMNLAISAIKFFFRHILKNDDIGEKHRPRHDGRLPMILSKEEISKIFSLEENPKHRLLLMLVYSSGLRVSEVVALKKEHIDLSRKVIYIRSGKGRKDRSTLLSEKAARYIVEYYKFFNIDKWVFPGQPASQHLSIRSAQHIFDKALRRAAVQKNLSIHSLRHAFATHLLESGTDIRYIQELLGHSSIRTTERYTHVAKRNILAIKSPLDTIF